MTYYLRGIMLAYRDPCENSIDVYRHSKEAVAKEVLAKKRSP